MEEPINFIEKLEFILRRLSLVLLFIGIIGVISSFGYNSFEDFESLIEAITLILFGLLIFFICKGLLKKEWWTFYFLSFLLIKSIILNGVYLLFNFSFQSLDSLISTFLVILTSYLFYLLIKGKPVFTQQPKEKFTQWLKKPYCKISLFLYIFIIVLAISITILSLYMEIYGS